MYIPIHICICVSICILQMLRATRCSRHSEAFQPKSLPEAHAPGSTRSLRGWANAGSGLDPL